MVTASELLAETALGEGMYFQAFPQFGAERTGAPIRAFTRLSDKPIDLHCSIENPDIVMVLDPTLLGRIDVTEGMKEGGVLILNTDRSPQAMRQELGFEGGKLFTVDAMRIAMETIRRPIPNVPILGALIKATGLFPIDVITEQMRERFSKRFQESVVNANLEAIARGYQEAQEG